ncbi:MAG: kelch repeat-containing protein, partial [Acidobacteriota bacterium]
MTEPSKHTYRLLCPIPVLVGLMIGAITVPEPVARVSAQVGGSNWSVTGSLNKARHEHTATLLRNGKVLVVGGFQYEVGGGPLKSAELYDPATGKWTETGSLNAQRFEHTATLLADGKVLVTGGHGDPIANRTTAELYDPISETWSFTGNLSEINLGRHEAVLLPNGKVFIRTIDGTDTYDPTTRTWRYQQINSPRLRQGHTTTVLADGRVLVAGGGDYDEYTDEFHFDVSAELYDQMTGARSLTGNLLRPRSSHTATLLHTGQVLVMSGQTDSVTRRSAELYDPVTGTWLDTGKLPEFFFDSVTTTLLVDGKVLVTGFD